MQCAPDNAHEDFSASPPPGPERVPRHVAIIMDGNGRWARRLGLSRRRGHSEGAESVRAIIREIRPEIQAKGTDYTADSVPERDAIAEYGGRVEIVGDAKDHSSSAIIRSRLAPRKS